MKQTVWNSRLPDRKQDRVFEKLNASIDVDIHLFMEEITATKAHAIALEKAGIYTQNECSAVCRALERIEREIRNGELDFEGFEDVHSLIEKRLSELTGEAGEKIQTARSRNEQTITAQRLFLKRAIYEAVQAVTTLQYSTIRLAETTVNVIMPGYTHCRPAQPMRVAAYYLSLFFGLERDKGRMMSALDRVDNSSAGVAALGGATFQLDRSALAETLGFSRVSENALDTVSDRDGQMEFLSILAILMVRLSRIAEDLIMWSSPAYGFVILGDTYCTSSSLMPQKKNPDGLELLRGKAGRVISDLFSLLITCKGLPSGYQKDLQEDKEPLFDAFDTTLSCLHVCAGILDEIQMDPVKSIEAVTDECLATDMADQLVESGAPFRNAYQTVARRFLDKEKGRAYTDLMEHGVTKLTPEESVERRNVVGGTSRKAVMDQIALAKKIIEKNIISEEG